MTTGSLVTTEPEQLILAHELLKMTVLGGIKLDGLDRMRATLKIESPDSSVPPVRHSLDLYNDNQVEKLVRRVAERLEIGTSVIAASLAELTEQLEEYRMEQIKGIRPEQYRSPVLSKEERSQAESFLKAPTLLKRTNELIGQSGVIGEDINRLLMLLIFTSRKTTQPLHIVSLGSSGTGKTHLQEKVGELIPEEDKLEITTLSENAFYYFGQRELKNKLILIEDLDGAENVLYPLRELQSKRKISKTIAHKNSNGETRTVHLVVEGPVSVSGCTTRERIYEDNANRSFLIYLDESEQQDQLIMAYQRALSAGKIDPKKEEQAAELLKNCQRLLEPIRVINPFAEQLLIPKEVFKPRRTNAHYLAFVEVVTFYHQFQRKHQVNKDTGEVFIETTLEDIIMANGLLKETLLRKSDELSGACRNYFECLKLWMKDEERSSFKNSEARVFLRENHSNQKRYMTELLQVGLIQKGKGDRKNGYEYKVVSTNEYALLREGIVDVLDQILAQLKNEVSGSKEVHQDNEPLKPSGSKGKVKKSN